MAVVMVMPVMVPMVAIEGQGRGNREKRQPRHANEKPQCIHISHKSAANESIAIISLVSRYFVRHVASNEEFFRNPNGVVITQPRVGAAAPTLGKPKKRPTLKGLYPIHLSRLISIQP